MGKSSMTKQKTARATRRASRHGEGCGHASTKRQGMILRPDRPGLAKVWPAIPSASDSATICTVALDEPLGHPAMRTESA